MFRSYVNTAISDRGVSIGHPLLDLGHNPFVLFGFDFERAIRFQAHQTPTGSSKRDQTPASRSSESHAIWQTPPGGSRGSPVVDSAGVPAPVFDFRTLESGRGLP